MTANEAVAAEIRAELARQRLSQADLARRLEVSRPWVSRRLNVLADFSIADVAQIADALGLRVADLVRPIDDQRVQRTTLVRARSESSEQTA